MKIPFTQNIYGLTIENNIEDADPRFTDEDNINLDIQNGSPAYSLLAFKRVPFEEIGVKLSHDCTVQVNHHAESNIK